MESASGLLTIASAIGQAVQELSLDEALDMLGLARRRGWVARALSPIGLAAAGALMGAGIALLLTPSSGRELRKRLFERAGSVKERLSVTVGDLERRLNSELQHARAA